MADTPYISWYTSDFLQGIADLTLEQIGVYAVVLNLIADKAGPIDDDPRWLARRSGSTTRTVSRILDQLQALGKLERKNGVIGNRRMLQEVGRRNSRSAQNSDAAKVRWDKWRAENKPQLPLDLSGTAKEVPLKNENRLIFSGQTSQSISDLKPPVKTGKQENSANSDMQTHSDSRARAFPYSESYVPNNQSEESVRSADEKSTTGLSDFMSDLSAVSAAAGFIPHRPDAIAKAIDYLKRWRDAGADLETIALPTIRRIVSESSEPTNSLARFDKAILHACARANISPRLAPREPIEPLFTFDAEPDFTDLRKELLKRLGKDSYIRYAHSARFDSVDNGSGKILRISQQGLTRLYDDERPPLIRAVAKQFGFSTVWG